jgi:hypothetical protein
MLVIAQSDGLFSVTYAKLFPQLHVLTNRELHRIILARDSTADFAKEFTIEYTAPRKANLEKSRGAKLQILREK